ncbi:MAG TPA: glycosyltransferase family 4 protein [Polyangiaceae bacterium]
MSPVPTLARRIAWLVYGSLEQVSGGYIYDRLVVEQLRQLGDEVTVVSLAPGQSPPCPSRRDFDCLVGDELCFRELGPLFRGAEPGMRRVLLIHHLTAWEHAPGPEREAVLELERAAIAAADACVATSFVTAERLRAEGILGSAHVAEPGADRLPRPSLARPEDCARPVRLLFIGNLLPRKGVLELLQAFAELPSDAQLVLVGAEQDAGYAAQLLGAAAQPAVAGRVLFLGALGAAGVAEELARADALVLPSRLEGYGMVLSEALWAGVPVIAARVGAAERLVELTRAGITYDPDQPGALTASLRAFVQDSAQRSALRRAAWHAADALPRWRTTALNLQRALLRCR